MRRAILAIALVASVAPGCGNNGSSDLLIPTGIRMRPGVGSGAITVQLYFDPRQFPDLAAPPFPPTLVRLYLDGSQVDSLVMDGSTRVVRFDSLFAGSYSMTSSAYLFFSSTLGPIPVVDQLVDAGNDTLPVNSLKIASTVHLMGEFNGFPPDFPDSIAMVQNQLGVWSYPNLDYPAQLLEPGSYRIRFVTDFSFDGPTDYGGNQSIVYPAPAIHAPARLVSGPGTDLTIQITSRGRYAFTLDERRQTFSVEPLTESAQNTKRRRPS